MEKRTTLIATVLCFVIVALLIGWIGVKGNNSPARSVTGPGEQGETFVTVEQFGANGEDSANDSAAIQAAIDYSAESTIGKVRLAGNKSYILTEGIVVRENVELEFDQNTKVYIEGDFRAFELKRNASLTNGIIEVSTPKFNSELISIEGNQKNWSTERTRVHNVTLVNSSGSHKGTALSLTASKPGDYISFVNISDVSIVGFNQGIRLEAKTNRISDQYTWINGNRFTNITLDDCVRCIHLIGQVTVPNETSGNQFSQLQIQVSKVTQKAIVISGSANQLNGVIWDAHLAKSEGSLIELTSQSADNDLDFNLPHEQVMNSGTRNMYK
ncbi:hypothetical protein [Pseudalkalibacillus hwajinpoensis]|uniref:Pectate lyase superfamily protein domain-containing protein n=1 Tax=Guptibacillus hwajinpoensis TaxID=208199 RepID=A0A4U1MJV5_9BACL|nr:hypothetical protein [Pseudalkalibacillus hwajinpoensis]TKD70806.1 hypothetical protein FBF83_09340 [Pseudalkalibacillus hwajinpoensis]